MRYYKIKQEFESKSKICVSVCVYEYMCMNV